MHESTATYKFTSMMEVCSLFSLCMIKQSECLCALDTQHVDSIRIILDSTLFQEKLGLNSTFAMSRYPIQAADKSF